MPIIETKADLATFLQTSATTIQKWTKHADFPGGRDGPWEGDDVLEFLTAEGSPLATPSAGQSQDARAKTLLQLEQLRWRKLRNDEMEGRFIDRAAALDAVTRLVIRIRDRLQAIPEEVTAELPADIRHTMQRRMEEKIALILTEMAQWQLEEPAR